MMLESRPGSDPDGSRTAGDTSTPSVAVEAPSSRVLHIARGARAATTTWTSARVTWAEVAAWVSAPRTGPKDGPAYVLGQLEPCDCGTPKKPHAHRRSAAVLSRGVLALDADHLTPADRDGLLTKLRALGWMTVIYSTYQHTAAAPRLRVLLLLDRDINSDEYNRVADVVMQDLQQPHQDDPAWSTWDATAREPERLMYMPTVSAADLYEHHVMGTGPLPVDDVLARWDPVEVAHAHPTAKRDPLRVPGLVGTFNREYSIDDAIEVFGLPYVTVDDRLRYEPATSEPGVVRVTDDLIYSHHANDPAYGQACSAFDLVRLHRFGKKDTRVKPGTSVQDRPSQKAMLAFARDDARVAGREASETFLEPAVATVQLPEAISLEDCHAVFRRWLGASFDLGALDAVLSVVAVERIDGDPLWLLVVAASGHAKTETVQALVGAGAVAVSTISSAGALLSASPRKDRGPDATGGLLREVQPRGLIVIKDVTSILSMSRDARAEVMAALREVYDGSWTRTVGTDGGRKLLWQGRIGLVGAVTTAWDQAHAAVAAMGDRFVLVRTDSRRDRIGAARQTLRNTGREVQMRQELATAVAGVIAGMGDPPADLSDAEADRLIHAANLVAIARTAVELDYRGQVETAHDAEAATRIARQLQQVFRGAVALGATRTDALDLAIRCARDTMPPLRLRIIDYLAAHPGETAAQVCRGLDEPRSSVRRQLDGLHALRVLTADRDGGAHDFEDRDGHPGTGWQFSLRDDPDLDPAAIALGGDMHDGCRTVAQDLRELL